MVVIPKAAVPFVIGALAGVVVGIVLGIMRAAEERAA